MMEAPRHTAQEVAEQVANGMDPDVESVAAQYYDAMKAERDELKRKLEAIRAAAGDERPLLHCLNCDDFYEGKDLDTGACPDCGGDFYTESERLRNIWDTLDIVEGRDNG